MQIERAGKFWIVGCSDVEREPTPPRHVWRAVAGTLTVRPFPLPQQPVEGSTDVLYGSEITINALRVQGPNGQQAAASKAIVLTGKGGWGPG